MSLRWRWALTLGTVAALAIGLSIAATLGLAARQLRDQVDEDLLQRAQAVADEPFRALRPVTRPGGVTDLDAIVRVLDPSGEVVLATPNDPGFRPDFPEGDQILLASQEIEDRLYRVVSRRIEVRGSDGVVQIGIDITRDARAVSVLIGRLLVIGLGATVAAGWIGWLLAGRATRPIRHLSEVASEVARTERLDADLDTDAAGEVGTLARSFKSMLDALATSRRQQQSLVSNASHELRTPLTALRTNLETLQRSFDRLTPEQRQELVAAAVAEVHELAELSAELVDLATDVRHSDEPTVTIDLGDLAQRVADRFARRTSVAIQVEGEGTEVDGRLGQIDRALTNLVSNAIKWSPPDGTIRIVLAGSRVTVLDDGPGFAPADLDHVFERFYRSDAARTTPGSGLGLAIVEHVVAAHGGSVFATNRPEGGAAVGFAL
jgi:two-component system, OmpR family, sensor histidine kinase MprB